MITCEVITAGYQDKVNQTDWKTLADIIADYYNKYEVIDLKFAGQHMDYAYIIYVEGKDD